MSSLSRLVFFGTPEFAVPTLAALVEAGRRPQLVVTQPARPVGRGGKLTEPPVALLARELGLPLAQPEKVREPVFLEQLRALAPDIAVVVAFGQIFPTKLLKLPRWGCMNLHASLLPKHRGAAPIQAAIAEGDRETGVTTMKMEKALDAGPMLLQRPLPIGELETAGELSPRLARLGAELVLETMAGLEAGTIAEQVQDSSRATYAPMIAKEDGRINFELPAAVLVRRLRAFTPWPGLFAQIRGEAVKVLAAETVNAESVNGAGVDGESRAPGTFAGIRDSRLLVCCGGGTILAILRAQRPGRGVISGADLANGLRLVVNEALR